MFVSEISLWGAGIVALLVLLLSAASFVANVIAGIIVLRLSQDDPNSCR
jgi:hypothetical protein